MKVVAFIRRAVGLQNRRQLQVEGNNFTMSSHGNEQVHTEKSSPEEDRRYNSLSEMMSSFHQWFKDEFNKIYDLADGSYTKYGLSLSLYLDMAKHLNSSLTMHHTVEERHIFPILAQRMPEFSTSVDEGHLNSHRGIHKGLARLSKLVNTYSEDPKSYSPTEMRACLDSFREVLFTHLDEEVYDLRGENMKKYFTVEEVEGIGRH